MIYDLQKEMDRNKFKVRSDFLLKKQLFVELKDISRLSNNQNSYLHLILNIFAIEYGDTLENVKSEIFKELVNPDIFIVKKVFDDRLNRVVVRLKSINDITKDDINTAIERFKIYASKECGIFIPDAFSEEERRDLLYEINKRKNYL